jgi:hypothetical protein
MRYLAWRARMIQRRRLVDLRWASHPRNFLTTISAHQKFTKYEISPHFPKLSRIPAPALAAR